MEGSPCDIDAISTIPKDLDPLCTIVMQARIRIIEGPWHTGIQAGIQGYSPLFWRHSRDSSFPPMDLWRKGMRQLGTRKNGRLVFSLVVFVPDWDLTPLCHVCCLPSSAWLIEEECQSWYPLMSHEQGKFYWQFFASSAVIQGPFKSYNLGLICGLLPRGPTLYSLPGILGRPKYSFPQLLNTH